MSGPLLDPSGQPYPQAVQALRAAVLPTVYTDADTLIREAIQAAIQAANREAVQAALRPDRKDQP